MSLRIPACRGCRAGGLKLSQASRGSPQGVLLLGVREPLTLAVSGGPHGTDSRTGTKPLVWPVRSSAMLGDEWLLFADWTIQRAAWQVLAQ
jgi:hypothetical protein